MSNDLKTKTFSNLIWRFAERCGAQGVAFVVSIVLARLLTPSDYGTLALVVVFTNILQILVDTGISSALVQKKDADELDFSTVFYANIVFCIVVYGIAFAFAPFVAAFYGDASLTAIIRVLSITILISGIKNIQQAYVSKNLIFKKFFFSSLAGILGSAIVGIVMAYNGFGVWALVAQQVTNNFINAIVMWFTVKWRPKILFSFERLKGLVGYGWKILVSNLINTVYNDIRQLIIGKVYSSADLAYYNRGKQFPVFIVSNTNTAIDSVLLPVMSQKQDDRQQVKNLTRRSIQISSYIMWPLMFGLMAIGEPLIRVLLTEKWIECVPYLYIFCFVNGMMPIHTANLNAIKAMGRSDMYLKLEIIKKSGGLLLIISSMHISVFAMAISSIVYTIFASVVNSFPNKKLLDYSYWEQIKDILPSFVLSASMAIIVYLLPLDFLNIYAELIIKIIVGAVIYVLGSICFKLESFTYVKNLVIKR